jgi:hypothetical protein
MHRGAHPIAARDGDAGIVTLRPATRETLAAVIDLQTTPK